MTVDRLIPPDPDAPSELELEQLATGDLDTDVATQIRERLTDEQAARLDAKGGWEAHPGVDPDALFARIEARLEPEPSLADAHSEATASFWKRALDWLRTPQGGGLVLALAALGLIVLTSDTKTGPNPDPLGEIRAKGSLQLRVFVKRAASTGEMASGERFEANDLLRFVIDVPKDGHGLILHTDAAGRRLAAWPLGAEVSVPLTKGEGIEIEDPIELDDAKGKERLTLIRCDAPFELMEIPGILSECQTTEFTLDKGK